MTNQSARWWCVFIAAIILLLRPHRASANGGPVDEPTDRPELGGGGGITPLEETGIMLQSESLWLGLVSQENGDWRARADYRLANPGPARSVLFGVPTSWRRHEFRGDRAPDEIVEGAMEIRIALNGRKYQCEPKLAAQGSSTADIEAWCVVRLEIPTGEEIPLTLEYSGYSAQFGTRSNKRYGYRVTYLLWPAGFWRGPVRRVSIEIDLGQFAGPTRLVRPTDAFESDGKIRWEGTNVDLKRLQAVVLEYRGRSLNNSLWPDGNWLRATAKLEATASSRLAPQGRFDYSAARAIDGDRGTAWCEGVKGDGLGESLTVSVGAPDGDRECRILDYELVPGLASKDSVYRANGRIVAGRIESCDGKGGGFPFRLAAKPWKDESGNPWSERDHNVWPGLRPDDHVGDPPIAIGTPRGVLETLPACVRLVIDEVRRGDRYQDTCIGEFVPRVYCRSKSAEAPGR